ncbi:AraC family transcriptional regulator [Luteimonas saliphila]|uniref:AraC family transcriptional regulator n=1 Tax=Luteimonas saliphila TaxID=2804919 RepID=UPI00192D47CA|nr:GyrI-like domain-containing protein [Luteimonas saliphila]
MKTDTRIACARRIDAVVAHLQATMARDEPLPDLADLARIAHFSPFHFHRVWRALTGEPVGRTVSRLRLLRALELLRDADVNITTVAQAAGYDTAQAFARAFRDALDASPGEVRGRPERIDAAVARLGAPTVPSGQDPALQVEVVSLAPFEVVALRNRGAFADLDAAFGRLFGWAAEAGVVDSIVGLHGVPHADHREVPPETLEFDCAIELAVRADPSPPLQRMVLDGGTFARVRHVGAYDGLEDLIDRVLAHWWPDSGHALRDVPIRYAFQDDPEVVPESLLRADILLPLAPGAS